MNNAININEDRGYRVTGSKYQRNLDIKEIAKIIRTDLRKNFKGFKFSVKIKRYTGGQSLNVSIKDVPENFILFSDYYTECLKQNEDFNWALSYDKYSDEAIMLKRYIEHRVSQYNYDDSDTQTDYFNVNFYSHIDFGWEFERATEKKIKGLA